MFDATTILAYRGKNKAVIGGDGQVTFGQTVLKNNANKIRALHNGEVLAGFAGSTADAFNLFDMFEEHLPQRKGELIKAALNEEALVKLILTKPKNSLLEQYKALLSTEAVTLEFEDSAIHAIAHYAQMANEKTEDIGARRLHTVVEKVLEEISFNAHLHKNETITVTKESVNTILSPLIGDEDLARHIP